jgi:hypothetical protein
MTMAAAAAAAKADTISVDIFDVAVTTPSVLIDGQAATLLPDSGADFAHFLVDVGGVFNFPTYTGEIDLVDSSDKPNAQLLFTYTTGSGIVDVRFASVPLVLPPGDLFFGNVIETGQLQPLPTFRETTSDNTLAFFAAKNPPAGVPEPASFALVITGVAGCGVWRSCRATRRGLRIPDRLSTTARS